MNNEQRKELLDLWGSFGDIPINDNDEIEEPFLQFDIGTNRFEVWKWFDERYPNGVYNLINDYEAIEIKGLEDKRISALALYKRIKAACNPYGNPIIDYQSALKVMEMIQQATDVCNEEVIHCKDCSFYEHVDGYSLCSIWQVFGSSAAPPENGFCHCASRKIVGD